MSAERLREAADRLDALAGAATPGPWEHYDVNAGTMNHAGWMVANDAFHNPPADEGTPWLAVELYTGVESDAAYIAAMHPGVGKALAHLLRLHAAFAPNAALAVADAILGGAS